MPHKHSSLRMAHLVGLEIRYSRSVEMAARLGHRTVQKPSRKEYQMACEQSGRTTVLPRLSKEWPG